MLERSSALLRAPAAGTQSAGAARPAYILTLSCEDRPGRLADVAGALAQHGANLLESAQFGDPDSGRFFMRAEFDLAHTAQCDEVRDALGKALGGDAQWQVRSRDARRRVLIMVSHEDHCLADLLYRNRIGELNMDVVGIISNHPQDTLHVSLGDIPYHHLPVAKGQKAEQEAQAMRVIDDSRAELVVLARYMQILSDQFSSALVGRCINIHHSFLPGFKGARPYHQAYARGVKFIGATSHYVTPDLDEGPIIAQDVEPITHADRPEDLVRKGRDIERRVLARGVRAHLQDRVLLNGSHTVVF